MKGIFITMEGPDGSGKSTQIRLLEEYLQDKGYNVVVTREPGGTRISEDIRKVILDTSNTNMSPYTEALLYAASRAQHVHEVILPALRDGKIVICDRFVDSSLVYQGFARGLGIDKIKEINDFATGGLEPDITLFFDIDADTALKRIGNRTKRDRLDKEDIKFHRKVYEGYMKIKEMYSHRIEVINATYDIENIFKHIKDVVDKILELNEKEVLR
ncbi:dTMP kinase [Caloranaerobacter azorensis DSM 13643]|uniref:Thymidylate kinase n=1 Tax=Caloranaerobacter azorensis DSM 13643 TaxID=1121264 RepID=A0A1M5T6X4_9FIRM|nr:dTMP kinase [Caloranaerobacter azorensis]SHH46462.1 dTMP kinase [Caloranaerobacter azorensis DSM 13643]